MTMLLRPKSPLLTIALCVILAVAAASGSARANTYNTYYLSPSGDDGWSGTQAKPWRTLKHACTQLHAGDVLKVGFGTYNYTPAEDAITTYAGTALQPITVKTYNGTPVFAGTDVGVCLNIFHSYWVIDGIEIKDYNSGIVVENGADNITIKNCYLHDMHDEPSDEPSSTGIYMHSSAANPCSNVIVQACTFRDIPDVVGWNGEGIYVNGGIDGQVSNAQLIGNWFWSCLDGIDIKPGTPNCLVRGNQVVGARGIGIFYGSNGTIEKNLVEWTEGTGTFAIELTSGALCRNNIVRNNAHHGIYVNGYEGGDGNRIFNNTVCYNSRGIYFEPALLCDFNEVKNNIAAFNTHSNIFDVPFGQLPTTNTLDYNDWYGGYWSFHPRDGIHTIHADPLFVLPPGDLHLQALASPCQNAGVNLGPLVPDDFDGVPRGLLYDIGAYEVPGGGRPIDIRTSPTTDAGSIQGATRLQGARPNPFRPATTISFELGQPGRVEVSILDVQGALVRRLVDEELAPGPHQVVWDGRGESARPVSAGIYLIQLKTPTVTLRSKAMLMK